MSESNPTYAVCAAPNCRRGNTEQEYKTGRCWRCGYDKFEVVSVPSARLCGGCGSPQDVDWYCTNTECRYHRSRWGRQFFGPVGYTTSFGIHVTLRDTSRARYLRSDGKWK